jgi:hypothetical protein
MATFLVTISKDGVKPGPLAVRQGIVVPDLLSLSSYFKQIVISVLFWVSASLQVQAF